MLEFPTIDLLGARYGSYPDMLDVLRERTLVPQDIGRKVFERIVFNVAIGNNDDHARNHAAFWDGQSLELTPAFDLTPQVRSTDTSAQAMDIGRDGGRGSQFAVCVAAAADYGLSRADARDVVDLIVTTVEAEWPDAADVAALSEADRNALWRRSVLNRPTFTTGIARSACRGRFSGDGASRLSRQHAFRWSRRLPRRRFRLQGRRAAPRGKASCRCQGRR